jgi:hypothetical protein
VTEGIRLVQEKGEQRGVVMYQVAFATQRAAVGHVVRYHASPWGWCPPCSAWAMCCTPPWASLDPGYLAVCLIDPAAPAHRQWLAGQCRMQQCRGHPDTAFQLVCRCMLGERTWLFQVAAGPRRLRASERGWVVWGTFTVSLLAVAMLGAFSCWC